MKYCMKHPDRPATHTLKSGDDTFTFLLCETCGYNAVANGAHPELYLGNVVENPRFPPEGERIAKGMWDDFRAELEGAVKDATNQAKAELERQILMIIDGFTQRLMERIQREFVGHVRADDKRKA